MSLCTAVVGYTTQTTSRISAFFTETSGAARLVYQDDAGTHTVDQTITPAAPFGRATFELKGLSGKEIRYGIAAYSGNSPPADIAVFGNFTATFRTIESKPVRVALVSCNDIDNHAFPKAQRGAMWRKLKALVTEGAVDVIVHAGDQIYGDGVPAGWSETEGKVGAYRRHYVQTWSHPDVQSVLSSCPNVMMWDDHEIYDGWGSNDNDVTEAAQNRYQAAETAFREFQAALNPQQRFSTSGFGWVAQFGDLAILAVDGRSQRRWATGAVLGKKQLDDLEVKLGQLADLKLKHLLVVVGTPVVYLPLIAAEQLSGVFSPSSLDDIRDGWGASNNQNECRRFLMSLLNFAGFSPETQVTIVAGDIHVGTLAHIETKLGFGPNRVHPRIYQVTSSGIGRPGPKGTEAFLMSLVTNGGSQRLFNGDICGFLREIQGSDHKYCVSHRNFAVLDPSDGNNDWDKHGNLWVRFYVESNGIQVLEQALTRMPT